MTTDLKQMFSDGLTIKALEFGWVINRYDNKGCQITVAFSTFEEVLGWLTQSYRQIITEQEEVEK